MKRDLKLDTLKGILIILVVFGHIIERTNGDGGIGNKIYEYIYIFHMPLFIFISGFLTKPKDSFKSYGKSIAFILLPCCIFHCIHVVGLLLSGYSFDRQFCLIPSWTLWFLVSLAYWRTFIQFFPNLLNKYPLISFCTSIIISLICGLLPGGSIFAIQRTMHFLPFFLLGYYIGNGIYTSISIPKPLALGSLLVIGLLVLFNIMPHDSISLLYGSIPYGYDRIIPKAYLLLCSFIMTFSIYNLCEENLFFARIGKDSLIYYLYHGLLIVFILTPAISRYNLPSGNIFYCVLYTAFLFVIIAAGKKLKFFTFIVYPFK